MRVFAPIVAVVALAGCAIYQPDQRVVGRFKAPTGEVVEIQPSGYMWFIDGAKKEMIGLVHIGREQPLTIRVVGPDTAPLVGTSIVFSADKRTITATWPSRVRTTPKGNRPTEFSVE